MTSLAALDYNSFRFLPAKLQLSGGIYQYHYNFFMYINCNWQVNRQMAKVWVDEHGMIHSEGGGTPTPPRNCSSQSPSLQPSSSGFTSCCGAIVIIAIAIFLIVLIARSCNSHSSTNNIVGHWSGISSNNPARLNIERQDPSGNFSGTMSRGEWEIIINGQVRDNGTIYWKETKVTKGKKWILGENWGQIEPNGSMSGRGDDGVNSAYNWSFRKR